MKLKRKGISKMKYNRNFKKPVTHKTVIEAKLIFETEISLEPSLSLFLLNFLVVLRVVFVLLLYMVDGLVSACIQLTTH